MTYTMLPTVTCDFCGKAFQWTQQQDDLDRSLRRNTSCDGLGASCDECDEKQLAIFLAEDAAILEEEDDG